MQAVPGTIELLNHFILSRIDAQLFEQDPEHPQMKLVGGLEGQLAVADESHAAGVALASPAVGEHAGVRLNTVAA